MVESLVAELRSATEQILIPTNDSLVTKFDMEVLVSAVGEANAVLAVLLLSIIWAS